jgi:hypothetical protein
MAPRTLLCCLVLLALAGCGGDEEAGGGSAPGEPAPATRLTVSVDPDGDGPEPAKRSTATCGAGQDDRKCAAVAKLRPEDFEPTPDDVACTELFGGPQTATVSGTLDGTAVEGRFARHDGCEIARWDKLAGLLGEAGP